MRTTSRRGFLTMTAGGVLVGLVGCGGDDEGATSEGVESLAGKRIGAMKGYGVGDQLEATKPLTFSLLYNDHPNYPLQKDWMFWTELRKRTNVTLDNTVVPLSDYEQKRSVIIGSGDAPLIISKTYPGRSSRSSRPARSSR